MLRVPTQCYEVSTQENKNLRKEYPFNLSKPLSLIMDRGRQVIHVDYFINNDLEYLKGGSLTKKYMTSVTKTKVAKYDIPGIEDMVPLLWSLVKVAYDRHAVWGTSHLGPKRQRFYGFAINRVSKHDVYSTKRIIAVTKVKVMMWYEYDMLLLLAQKKLSNLKRYDVFNLGVVLWMFTKRMVILKRVEDLQLGVESYQKKLNITKPETFSDGTLTFVRDVLYDIASNPCMVYLSKRRWNNIDKKRSRIMIKANDKQLLEKRLMRSLEKFFGGRDYGEDLRLLERTICVRYKKNNYL
nr:hypothetical protein [Tanacetum cinerariifolium]